MVEPAPPFEGAEFEGREAAPSTGTTADLGLEKADRRLGEGVVTGNPDAVSRGRDAGLAETFAAADGQAYRAVSEPARKEVERYQAFVILRLCREDGGTRCHGMIPLALSIGGTASAIQAI